MENHELVCYCDHVTKGKIIAAMEQGAKTLVFTALDKDGQPTNLVEVETGFTDGENVEITSGLEEGQKIYYPYYDTVEINTSAEASKYTFR